jgi:hypothetical protein
MGARTVHRDDRQPRPRTRAAPAEAHGRPAGPAGPVGSALALQRQIGNRALTALVARQPAPATFSGRVFLPGEENVGRSFKLEGTNIVDDSGKTKRVVGTIDADGRYTLVDDKGNPIPGATGKLGDLVGQVTEKGGKTPGRITSTTGSGGFSVWDAEGTKHTLKVKDGSVFETVGKRQELVGDVDVAGHYRVKSSDHVLTGSLTDRNAPVSVGDVSLERSDAKGATDKLQIGHDPVPEGVLVLREGKFTVKNGQLFPQGAKRAVGSVTIVRRGAKLDQLSLDLRYQEKVESNGYTGFIEHQTDLGKYPPAVGSVLRLGKGESWIVSDGDAWIDMGGHHVRKGFELSGGGRVDDKLRALAALKKVTVTNDEIEIMQRMAQTESGGNLEDINTYDSDVVSLGFIQYTMAGELQELIAMAPEAFARYGIKLGPKLTLKRWGEPDLKVPGIEGVKDLQELRGLEWAVKFFRAGLDPEVIAAQVKKAQADFATVTKNHLGAVSGVPLFQTPRVKAIIFELYNNRRAYVADTVRLTAAELKKHPTWTEDDLVTFMLSVMEDQYVTKNFHQINGKTDEEARQKARNIVTRTGHK